MSHTEQFNRIMERSKPIRKEKQKAVTVNMIPLRERTNELQLSLSKCTYTANTLYLPFERLDNYDELKKALMGCGAKYKNNTFVFPSDADVFINRLMDGESVNLKKEFQYYPTPKNIVQKMMDAITWHDNIKTILEPSAGQGAIVQAINEHSKVCVDYCELMEQNAEILQRKNFNAQIISADFMDVKVTNYYDLIVMNPPFAKNQDIDHVTHAYKCLKKGGQMVAITSPHWTFANDKKSVAFRDFINENGNFEEIESGEFKESGTNIKTIMITLTK